MLFTPYILAAGSLVTLSTAAPILHRRIPADVTSIAPLKTRDLSDYVVFGGNGLVADGWPSLSDWISDFDTMFDMNNDILKNSCAQWGVPNNSDDEINDISSAIKSVSSETGVDSRFILAIMLQESNGCVRAPTTNYGVRNPGLMQDHNGSGTCNDGSVQNPCPASEIKQMITDGVAGTASGDGLKQCLAAAGTNDVSMYYKAARIYNSGSIASSGNLGDGIATHCYSSDIANRLLGWAQGPSACNANIIGTLTGIVGSIPKKANNDPPASSAAAPAPAPTTTSAAAPPPPAPTTPAAAATTSAPAPPPAPTTTTTSTTTSTSTTTTTHTATATATVTSTPVAPTQAPPAPAPTQPASSVASPAAGIPVYPWASTSCGEYYTVKAGDYCLLVEQQFNLQPDQLIQLNPGLDASCSNLWLGYQYCVKSA